jgi:4-hydroxyacetophenone monooxygenase
MTRATTTGRNPHAGAPFTDSDAAIAARLEDVSVPSLLCSLVHMTGDPAWIRSELRPRVLSPIDLQCGMSASEVAEARRRALPAIAAYRDAGCRPQLPSREIVREMMAFMAGHAVPETSAPMMIEELQLDGADARAVTWRDEIPSDVRARSPVVVIGCGESGIVAGIRLKEAGLPFTILEKIDGPGGTWRHNRYPGARVDVGSHHYSYSFEPSETWSEYYCRQPELQRYFETVVAKYGLAEHCRFDTEVTAATWDEATARWRVEVRKADGARETLDARFVICAVGALSLPRWPKFPGMESFAGPSFHSAEWPRDFECSNQRFALIGAGATGFQIAPTIAPEVKQLKVYQRTAQWMLPNPIYHTPVPPGDHWAMRHLPFYGRWYRFHMMYPGIEMGTKPYRRDPNYHDPEGRAISAGNALRREQLTRWIERHLQGRPDLIEKSIPYYPPTGKRILQDDGSWLRCLLRPNVELVNTKIERIEPRGVVTSDGVLREADVICYATGFRANEFLAPIDWRGRGGVSLRAQWGDEPSAYLGITVPSFPNLFLVYGPGTNLAHGASLFLHSECQVRYAMSGIHEVLARGSRAIEVRQDAHDAYMKRYRVEIDQLIWAHEVIEHSHYKNPKGVIFSLSPWPIEVYWDWTRAVDLGDYQLS